MTRPSPALLNTSKYTIQAERVWSGDPFSLFPQGRIVIANEDSEYFVIGLHYCEGRNDEIHDNAINTILFAKEFATECFRFEPPDLEVFLCKFYDNYRETYLLFKEIVGSG